MVKHIRCELDPTPINLDLLENAKPGTVVKVLWTRRGRKVGKAKVDVDEWINTL